jgi:hypothetical protein
LLKLKPKRQILINSLILTVLCNTIGVGAWTMDFPETWPGTKQELKFTDSDGNERTIEWGQNYGKQMEDPVYVSKAAAAWTGLRAGGINEVMAAAVIGSLTMESGFASYDFYGEEVSKFKAPDLANLTVVGDIAEQIKLAALAYMSIRLRGDVRLSHVPDRARNVRYWGCVIMIWSRMERL